MEGLLIALSFLTILPVKRGFLSDDELSRSVTFFPLVGFILGLIYTLAASLALKLFSPSLAAFLVLLLMVILTGGFHLDGLADTFDGLALGRSKEEVLGIMKKSPIGTFGVLALVILILLKWVALWQLVRKGFYYPLFLAPVWGRWALVYLAVAGKSAKEEGLGARIMKASNRERLLKAISWVVVLVLIVHIKGLLHILWLYPALLGYRWFWESKIGGITGDTMGAACEITEALILLFSLVGV